MIDLEVYQIATEGLFNPYYKARHKVNRRIKKEEPALWKTEQEWRKKLVNDLLTIVNPTITKHLHTDLFKAYKVYDEGWFPFLTDPLSYEESIDTFECLIDIPVLISLVSTIDTTAINSELARKTAKLKHVSDVHIEEGDTYDSLSDKLFGTSSKVYSIRFFCTASDGWMDSIDRFT